MDQTEVDYIGYSFHIKKLHSTAENTCTPKTESFGFNYSRYLNYLDLISVVYIEEC